VLFELISARYERRSLLITASRRFGECGKIFPMSRAIAAAARSNETRSRSPAAARDNHRRKAVT
jgi:DNA replication protein DnaC